MFFQLVWPHEFFTVYVGETGRCVRTRKREHADAINVKILKSELHAYRRRVAERFLINQKTCSCNVINRNNGANFPAVYSVFVANK